jgi:hypothetical protein
LAEIIALGEVRPPTGNPVSEVVDELEKLLEKAKNGDILGLLFAYVESNESVITGLVPGVANCHLMMSGASIVQHAVASAIYHMDD